jgi:predicted dehydrogenase
VAGSSRITFPKRKITSQPKAGKIIEVETPTHICGTMDFENGAIGQITTSFDVYGDPLPNIVVYGSEGTLIVPDPNGFGGVPKLRRATDREFGDVALTHGFAGNDRGVGVLDMAYAIRRGGTHRASGQLACHALEVMHAFSLSSETERHVHPEPLAARPAAMPAGIYGDERG